MTKQEEEIRLDMGDEYEQALSNAGVDELVDLAGENLPPFQPWTMDTKIINYLEFHGKILVSKERSWRVLPVKRCSPLRTSKSTVHRRNLFEITFCVFVNRDNFESQL